MKALFYFVGYNHKANNYWRFAITVADGHHDRYAVARDKLADAYPDLQGWLGAYICLTPEDVFKEI